jgi:hypothetical protein
MQREGFATEAIEIYARHFMHGQRIPKQQQSELLTIQTFLERHD